MRAYGTPHPTPPAISYRSLACFSHLALLTLFFFTKRQSQKGGHGTMPPSPKYAPALSISAPQKVNSAHLGAVAPRLRTTAIQGVNLRTWSWSSGWYVELRSWLRGFDARLGHLP